MVSWVPTWTERLGLKNRTYLELCSRLVQRRIASGAGVHTLLCVVFIFVRECRFGALLSQHLELFVHSKNPGQFTAPPSRRKISNVPVLDLAPFAIHPPTCPLGIGCRPACWRRFPCCVLRLADGAFRSVAFHFLLHSTSDAQTETEAHLKW